VPAIALAIVQGTSAGVLATCGDGVLDPDEQCDHGAANGQDDCCSVGCELVDLDYDGTCDALDPCENGQGTRIKESKLAITRLSTGAADDDLHLVGTMTVPNTPPIDPSLSGVRLRMFAPGGDPHGSAILDASLPPGSHWTRRRHAGTWTYHDPKGRIGGIRRLTVNLLPPIVPTTHLTNVVFSVTGRRGSYAVTPDMVTSEISGGLPQGNARRS